MSLKRKRRPVKAKIVEIELPIRILDPEKLPKV